MELFGHNCRCCQCMGCKPEAALLDGIVKIKPGITFNTNRFHPNGTKAPDGIEIRFDMTRPTAEVRDMLKAHGFKFSEKQTMWYARDNAKSRELVTYLEANEIDADDTQYEKRYLWAKVGSKEFFDKLNNYTEFMLGGEPKRFFRTKSQLLSSIGHPSVQIYNGTLRFKKFYNKIVGEDGETAEGEEEEANDDSEGTDEGDEDSNEESSEWKPTQQPGSSDQKLAERLRSLAQSMQKAIDGKLNSATSKQRPTPKRLRVAAQQRQEGYALRKTQTLLYALAAAHRTGTIKQYPLLTRIKTRAQVELLNRYDDTHGNPHEHKYLQSTFDYRKKEFEALGISTFTNWTDSIRQRDDLIHSSPAAFRPEVDMQAEKIKELEMTIKGMKIPGFFPTPPSLIERLVMYAGIALGDEVLEPSAGKGDILDKVKEEFGDVVTLHACEINPTLRQMLNLKGYEVVGNDFLEMQRQFDVILMNPPFENKQDIDHVTHALSLLKPGGRLAAIIGEGAFFRQQTKDQEFRELLSERNAFVSEPIKGAFKDAFNQTGITVRLVAINEDGSFPGSDDFEEADDHNDNEQDSTEDMDELELLELEAQAELEMLKLKIELEQKKKGLHGLDGIDKNKMNYLKRLAKKIELPALWDFK